MPTKAYTIESSPPLQSKLGDYIALVKPRLLIMVLLSTAMGFQLSPDPAHPLVLLNVLLGTALVGGAAHVLNQWYERIQAVDPWSCSCRATTGI